MQLPKSGDAQGIIINMAITGNAFSSASGRTTGTEGDREMVGGPHLVTCITLRPPSLPRASSSLLFRRQLWRENIILLLPREEGRKEEGLDTAEETAQTIHAEYGIASFLLSKI